MTQIGFIGLGMMGKEMTTRLLQRGYKVYVFDINQSAVEQLAAKGAEAAPDIGSLAREADVVCTCLPMPETVKKVYVGENGIFSNMASGGICLDFTTVGMDTSIKLAKLGKEKAIDYLDSPISGGPEGAAAGTLSIMVGGDKKAFEAALPILNVMGKNIQYCGPSGLGSAAKLINQYLVAANSLSVSEAMAAGAALGLVPEQLYNLLKTSYGDSKILRRHMDEYVLDRNFKPGGAVKYVLKDVKLANDLIKNTGIEPTAGQVAEKLLQTALDQGLGELDMSAIIQILEEKTGIIVQKK